MPIESEAQDVAKRFGLCDGPLEVPDDFDRMAEDEIVALFESGRCRFWSPRSF